LHVDIVVVHFLEAVLQIRNSLQHLDLKAQLTTNDLKSLAGLFSVSWRFLKNYYLKNLAR